MLQKACGISHVTKQAGVQMLNTATAHRLGRHRQLLGVWVIRLCSIYHLDTMP